MNFDSEALWSSNNGNTFKGDGLYINAADEDFSLSDRFFYDKSEDLANLAGWTGDASKLYGGNVAGEFTGMQSGAGTTKAFFAGASDNVGTNAKFFAQADGNIFHKSIARIVYAGTRMAGFSENSNVSDLTREFHTSETVNEGGAGFNRNDKLKVRYYHRFGTSKLVVNGLARISNTHNGGGSAAFSNTMYVVIRDLDDNFIDQVSIDVTATNYNSANIDHTIDVADLTDDTYYKVFVDLEAGISSSADTGGGDTVEANTYLREDFTILATT
ncbi:hypothetical protein ACG2F4_14405 [Halalkalibaculum sp. DA3122]|uniref:hypothetical protein n=1 Tax=Halalkalibaculum sp. DA3122 TaxID=3373607 RepID=UPI0037542C97